MITSNIIAGKPSELGNKHLQAIDPSKQASLEGEFKSATPEEIDIACEEAFKAWQIYKGVPGVKKAAFLRKIADNLESVVESIVQRATAETALPEGRIRGELGRTCGQLRMFALLVEEGSWVDARITTAIPDRKPVPRVDIRNMRHALGPVAVFAASNFPLAFSTAGGDTASALAAGCPVIVKAHSSHLGTNAIVAEAIAQAVHSEGLPHGVFSSVQGSGRTVGIQLVKHPHVKAVGFTGSLQGGMALVKAAGERNEPIPVFAEMGSNNPIFILPGKIMHNGDQVAGMIAGSVNLGVGQFCTNPGLLIMLQDGHTDQFLRSLGRAFDQHPAAVMLNEGIHQSYTAHKNKCLTTESVQVIYNSNEDDDSWKGHPGVAKVKAASFIDKKHLQDEIFGPFTLAVICKDRDELMDVAKSLNGQLTASFIGLDEEFRNWAEVIDVMTSKVGRLIYNGVPTGVEVCASMQHGGPFPASTDQRFTSVGTGAILRFSRPVSYQNCPDDLLPDELKTSNPLGIWRLVDDKFSNS